MTNSEGELRHSAFPIRHPALTVIIPAFNEAQTLDDVLRGVLQLPCERQVIVVDDASTDRTPELLERWERSHGIDVLRHVGNRGKGAAIRTALPFARGRLTIVQDGDLELNPNEIPRLFEPILSGAADIVVGTRFINSHEWTLSRIGVLLLNACARVLYGVRLSDEACCYKVTSTDLLRTMDLRCERFEFCPEVVAKAARMGLRFEEVPVSYQPRPASAGKKLRYRDGVQALATLWRWRRWLPDGPLRQTDRNQQRHKTAGEGDACESVSRDQTVETGMAKSE